MQAIRLKHGVIFVKKDGVTVRISANGECEISPILFESLEWDLRTEPPSQWEYITEGDIMALGKETYNQLLDLINKTNDLIYNK